MTPPSSFQRKTSIVNQRPIFYVISEGERTEIDYIQNLMSIYDKVVFRPISRSHPDPRSLLKSAHAFCKSNRLQERDLIIIFGDRDSWDISHIELLWGWEKDDPSHRMFLFSNPCFELWLLRHYEPGSGASTQEICSTRLEGHNPAITNKRIPSGTFSRQQCEVACRNSKSQHDWKTPGFTNVFKLINKLESIHQ